MRDVDEVGGRKRFKQVEVDKNLRNELGKYKLPRQ